MYKKIKNKIIKFVKGAVLVVIVFSMIFPYSTLTVLAQAVPVEEVGWNLEYNYRTAEIRLPTVNASVVSNTSSMTRLLGEIMAPLYHLATPGSFLTKDIYRYIMKHTEDELGIDKDIFRRMMRKPDAPTVDIVFAPTNPKVGEKITAFAIPRNFKNSNEKLYYTWYLVHDKEKNVEAGRREAMAIGARGGYDRALFGEPKDDDGDRDAYNASYGGDDGVGKKDGIAAQKGDCEGCACVDGMSMFGGEVTKGCFDDQGELLYANTDEYFMAEEDRNTASAKSGRGAINSDFISRCYRHNFGIQNEETDEYSGRDLIINCDHTFGREVGGGDGEFDASSEEDWGTNPENADTDGDGIIDEADLVGLSQNQFTWIYRKGDRVSVAVEGMSNIPINEGTTDRLRYKNKYWDGDVDKIDQSPIASPEQWYIDQREECEDKRRDGLIATGLSFDPLGGARIEPDDITMREYSDCMKDLWEHEMKPENDEDSFGDMTGYYKIMWAAPGICTEKKEAIADDDWCDTDGDIGFQYLKLYDPVEKGKQLMEVSVNVSPKNPQFKDSEIDMVEDFSVLHNDSTDMIVVNADVVSQDYINPDYLYYKWSVWSCEPTAFDSCRDITETLDFKSKKEGIGLRDIGFYPTNSTFTFGNRALLKIGVVVKKHKNSVMSSPGINGEYADQIFSNEKKDILEEDRYTQKYAYTASKLVEVSKHRMKINLYQANPTASGNWVQGKPICGEGSEKEVYRKICPVYQYQVIMAEVENAGEAISWQLNGENIGQTLNGLNNQEPNSTTIFFPVTGVDGELATINITSEIENEEETWEDDNISEARVFTIHKPMAKILNKEGVLDANSMQRAYTGKHNKGGNYRWRNGAELWWIAAWRGIPFNERMGVVDIPVTVIPRYLQDEVDGVNLILQSYANGKAMGNLASESRDVFEKIKFKNEKDKELNNFRIRTIRQFSKEHKIALKQSFGISPLDELVDDLEVEVKAISDDVYFKVTGENIALNIKQKTGKFFASTIENASEYLVFILRLAVSFVLVAMMAFGLVYGVKYIN